jgi:hypothetical protein
MQDAEQLLAQVKDIKDPQSAIKFVTDNKEQLGDLYDEAMKLAKGGDATGGIMDAVKGIFGK